MRLRFFFMLASVVALSAFVAACSSSELVHERTVQIDAVILGESGRDLKLVFVGGPPGRLQDDPCAGEYDVDLVETGDETSITLYELALADAAPVDCTAEGHLRALDVELEAPVAARVVVDGHDGSMQWVIDPAQVLWPGPLPDGWIVRSRDASDSRLYSRFGPASTGDESLMLSAGPIDTESGWTLDAAMSEQGGVARRVTMRGGPADNAAEITSGESGLVTIAFDEAGLHYRVAAFGANAREMLEEFVNGLELDPTARSLEIPFEVSIAVDPSEASVIPTPTATAPVAASAPPTVESGSALANPEIAWPASESTRDVANYLEALRQGAYEQAAWPAANNGVAFDEQGPNETPAQHLERACGVDLCQGPYLVRGEPGYVDPVTSQAKAAVAVTHVDSGEETTMTIVTFEGQRLIAALPPLVASENDTSLHNSLFGDSVPEQVVVERFDAFEIWDGSSTEWVTNWHAEDIVQIEGGVVSTWLDAFALRDPQLEFELDCPRLIERDGQVLAVNQCVNDQWAISNVVTGESVEASVPFEPAGEAASAWYGERGGAVATGVSDAEGNLVTLRSADGVDLLGDDYASLAVISADGRNIAYVDHRDPAAASHFFSPLVVVKEMSTGAEVGRWTLESSVTCLEYAVDWIVACEADDAMLGSGAPDQVAVVAINPTTGELNRVETATRVFLPTG